MIPDLIHWMIELQILKRGEQFRKLIESAIRFKFSKRFVWQQLETGSYDLYLDGIFERIVK